MAAVSVQGKAKRQGAENGAPKVTPDALKRGQALERWLAENDMDDAQLARESGLNKMTIGMYTRGEVDIANMRQRSVEKLLTAMHVSDSWAWDYFDIPAERRPEWRTFREWPMGHGEEAPQGLISLVLDAPLSGEGFTAPVGSVVSYDPGQRLHGLLLTRLPGRYVVALLDALPSQGEVMGQFLVVSPGGA